MSCINVKYEYYKEVCVFEASKPEEADEQSATDGWVSIECACILWLVHHLAVQARQASGIDYSWPRWSVIQGTHREALMDQGAAQSNLPRRGNWPIDGCERMSGREE